MDAAIILAGGDPVDRELADQLPADAFVIAADSGLALADTLGLMVHVVVGDMDSVDPSSLADAEAAGTELERHQPDKDATDLELALRSALRRGARRVFVVGGTGGRLDHLLANAALLGADWLAEAKVVWLANGIRAEVVHDETELDAAPGELVTLLAVGGDAVGVSTRGLRWQLDSELLEARSTRGVSNEFVVDSATVRVESGVVLAVQLRGSR